MDIKNFTLEQLILISALTTVLTHILILAIKYTFRPRVYGLPYPELPQSMFNDYESESELNKDFPNKPTASPYCIVITNPTNEDRMCSLLGLGKNIASPNFGSDSGLIIQMAYSDVEYIEFLMQSGFYEFETELIQLISENESQFNNMNITVVSKDANGQSCRVPIIVSDYIKLKSQINSDENLDTEKTVDIYKNVNIDLNTSFEFSIQPNTKLYVRIFPMNTRPRRVNLNSDNYKAPVDIQAN